MQDRFASMQQPFSLAEHLWAEHTAVPESAPSGLFTPLSAGQGSHLITYTYTDGNNCINSATTTIVVNDLTAVNLADAGPFCVDAAAFQLSGTPAGGTYSGPGVSSSGLFTPLSAGQGSHLITYTYTDGNNCTNSATTTIIVNALPPVNLPGAGPLCLNSAAIQLSGTPIGGTYSGTGVSSAGLFTPSDAGQGSHLITYMYTDVNNCTASATTTINVNSLPVPTISGPLSSQPGATGKVYSTEGGKSGYTWTITGGTITAGELTNSITVTWGAVGTGTISVNYTDGNGCSASSPTQISVIIENASADAYAWYTIEEDPYSEPVNPTICMGGTLYLHAVDGQTTYRWEHPRYTVISNAQHPAGIVVGSSTEGGNYYLFVTRAGQEATMVLPVTIHQPVVPGITSNATIVVNNIDQVCINSAGNIYTTEDNMSAYDWTVSEGGTILPGTGDGHNSVTVTWTTTGAKTVSVKYTNGDGCPALVATDHHVMVNDIPVPTITGPNPACIGSSGNIYTTEPGMTNYIWTVSAGGTLTPNGNSATVTWNTTGDQSVSVNYTTPGGCTALIPTTLPVTVKALPSPSISGPQILCVGDIDKVYTALPAGMADYNWNFSNGNIGSQTGNILYAYFNSAGSGTLKVKVTDSDGCEATSLEEDFTFMVNALPVATISYGATSFCKTGTASVTITGQTGGTFTSDAQLDINESTGLINLANSSAGPHTITYSFGNGTCSNTATAGITINAEPTIAAAMTNQTLCDVTTATLDGTVPAIGTGIWTRVSGTGDVTTPTDPKSGVTGLTKGASSVFRWTISNPPCPDSWSDVTITVSELPTAANAGTDQDLCNIFETTVQGNQPTVGTGLWTVVSNHPTVNILTPGSPISQVTGLVADGPIILRWTISNGYCSSSSDDVEIQVSLPPTTADAGTDQGLCNETSANIIGNVPTVGTGRWTMEVGTGSITDADSPTTTITGLFPGAPVTMRWTISNGSCTSSFDDVLIINSATPTMPNAGSDQTGASTCGLTSVTLAGNNPSIGTGKWSIVSGAGGSLGDETSRTSSFSGTAGLSYTLRWTITNGNCSSSDEMLVTFNVEPTTADAGPDQTGLSTCGLTTVTLAGNAPGSGAGVWSVVSGTGGSFGNASSPTSTFSGTAGTTYTLRWTISNPPCTASTDDVVIEFMPGPAAAGTISGTTPICAGISGVNYSVPAIAGATSYIWAYSGNGATIHGTGNSVTIDFASNVTAGNLTVKGVNECGEGPVSPNYAIAVTASPVTTTGVTICAGEPGSAMTVTSTARI